MGRWGWWTIFICDRWGYISGELGWMNVFRGWVMVGGDIFWVGEGVWTLFIGEWEWMEVYHGWVGVGGHFYG